MKMTVTEIGRLAGCSGATVSRALNHSGAVSPKTREAVLNVLKKSAYPTRRTARHGKRFAGILSGEGPGLVEIILHRHSPLEPFRVNHGKLSVGPRTENVAEDWFYSSSQPFKLYNSYYRRILDGVVSELARWGHKAVLQSSHNLLDPAVLADMNRPDRLGILLLGEYSPDQTAFIEQCTHPMVLVDIIHQGWPDVVTVDNLAGIRAAFDHLHGLGHRRIGYIGRHPEVTAFEERFLSYKWKMTEAGLPVQPRWVYEGSAHIDATAEGVKTILQQPDRPTALLCANDMHALGVLRAATDLGLQIPGDLSVVGFDDEDVAAVVTPALTTMHVNFERLGVLAVRQLMLEVETGLVERQPGAHIRVQPELVVRQSTAAVGPDSGVRGQGSGGRI